MSSMRTEKRFFFMRKLFLNIFFLFLSTVVFSAVSLYKKPKLMRLKIGIAPRAFVALLEDIVIFSEKSKPPKNYRSGTVQRSIYKINLLKGWSEFLFSIGNVFAHPISDSSTGTIFFTRRLIDSSGDGFIGNDDNRVIFSFDIKRKKETQLTSNDDDFVLLDLYSDGGHLLAMKGNELFFVQLGKEDEKKSIGSFSSTIVKAFFDLNGTVFVLLKNNDFFQIKDGNIKKAGIGASIYISNYGAVFFNIEAGKPTFMKRLSAGGRKKHILKISGKNLQYLFPFSSTIDLFLYTAFANRKIVALNPRTGKYQVIYSFAKNVTRINFNQDFTKCVFLKTYDTDKNNYLSPGGVDKSAIYFLELAYF